MTVADGTWELSSDEADWTPIGTGYMTRQEAVAAAQELGEEHLAHSVWVGRVKQLRLKDLVRPDLVIDDVCERAYARTGLEDSILEWDEAKWELIARGIAAVLRRHCNVLDQYEIEQMTEVEGYRPPEDLDA